MNKITPDLLDLKKKPTKQTLVNIVIFPYKAKARGYNGEKSTSD